MNSLKVFTFYIITILLIGCSTDTSVNEYDLLLDKDWTMSDYVIHDTEFVEERNITFNSISTENSVLNFEKSGNQFKLRINTVSCGHMSIDVDFQNDTMILSNREILRDVEDWSQCLVIPDQRNSLTSLIVVYMYPLDSENHVDIEGDFEIRNDELLIYFSRDEQEVKRIGPVSLIFN